MTRPARANRFAIFGVVLAHAFVATRAAPTSSAAAAVSATMTMQSNCDLNHAITMSELSLCGNSDWAEVMIAASPKCSLGSYQLVMGVYDCETGQAVPKYWKKMPQSMSKDKYGSDTGADGEPGFVTLARFREYGKRGRTVDVEVRAPQPHGAGRARIGRSATRGRPRPARAAPRARVRDAALSAHRARAPHLASSGLFTGARSSPTSSGSRFARRRAAATRSTRRRRGTSSPSSTRAPASRWSARRRRARSSRP
jgi:hypothetical protein